MSSLIINGATTFGGLSNEMIDNIWEVDQAMERLSAAVAVAASGYGGTPGTEYETGTNFGVAPSAVPGAKGSDFAYAVGLLSNHWTTFKASALGAIQQLDNG